VKTLQAATHSGVSVYFRPRNGSSSELPAFTAAIEVLAAARFVVPLRAGAGWAERFDAGIGTLDALGNLDYCSQREQRLPPAGRTRWKGLLAPFPVDDPATGHHDLRAAYIWSSEEAATVAAARERALARAEEALTRIRNGLGGRSCKTRKQVDAKTARILGPPLDGLITVATGTRAGKPWISWARDSGAIAAASRLDGLYALATNLPDPGDGRPLTAVDVLKTYKDQWIIEQRHRDLKQTLRIRPVFLHNDDRIEALIAVIGLARMLGVKPRSMLTQLGEWTRLGFFTRTDYGTYALNTPSRPASSTTEPDP